LQANDTLPNSSAKFNKPNLLLITLTFVKYFIKDRIMKSETFLLQVDSPLGEVVEFICFDEFIVVLLYK